uniref:Uncharacterized protein n=1 Tax=Romanomermis culicivorax TaxID=13658 RepID=A0A915JJ91_ROMCU
MQIRLILLISFIALCRSEEEVEDIREIAKSNPVSIKSLGASKKELVQNKPSVNSKAFVVQENAAAASSLNSFINPPQIQRGQFAPNLNPTGIGSGLLNPGSFGGGLPQGFGGGSLPVATGGAGVGQQPQNSGILNVLNNLGKQLTGAVGLNGLLPQAGQSNSFSPPQIPRIPGQFGPQSGVLPNVPGLPLLPGAAGPNADIRKKNSLAAISRRAFNGSSLADIIPPIQAQKFADNITDTLLPSTAKLDLSRFMGRWFENWKFANGGLTENGKTATFTALKIYREGSEFGQVRYSIGYAFRGGRQGGMLQMHSSEATDPTPLYSCV